MRPVHAIRVLITLLLSPGMVLAQQEVREHGQFADVNGVRIYYEDRGQGEPLFLLHAFFGTASRWDAYVDDLASQYRVIAWDMRGHGRSASPTRSDVFLHKDVASDLLALMDHLDIDRAKALGVSSGAMTLLHASTLQPDRFEAIVLVGGLTYRGAAARGHTQRAPFLDDPEIVKRLKEHHGEEGLEQLARQFKRFATLYGDPAFTPDILTTISARALIVQGDNDAYVSVSQAVEMLHAIPRAHLWIVPHGGHLVHLIPESRDDFLRRIREFLHGQWEEDPG